MRRLLALTVKDLKIFFRDPGSVVLIFLMPFMFIVVMSIALAGLFGSGKTRPTIILAVNEDRGTRAAEIIKDLDRMEAFSVKTELRGNPLDRGAAEGLIRKGRFHLALVFPADFTETMEQDPSAEARRTTKVSVISDPATSNQLTDPFIGAVKGLMERTAYLGAVKKGLDFLIEALAPETPAGERRKMKDLILRRMSGRGKNDLGSTAVIQRTSPIGMRAVKYPNTYQQNVPGYTVFGVFWIVSLLAGSVLSEKKNGTFRRLMAAPLGKATMLLGKLVPYYLINMLQVAIMLGAGRLIFGLDLGSSLVGLVTIGLAVSAAATGMGVLVAASARTEAQVIGLTTILLLSLSALGGCFVPRFVMPEWLRNVGLATPHAWALEGFQDLLVRGQGLGDVLFEALALFGFAALFISLGVWRFRFERSD